MACRRSFAVMVALGLCVSVVEVLLEQAKVLYDLVAVYENDRDDDSRDDGGDDHGHYGHDDGDDGHGHDDDFQNDHMYKLY